MPKLKTVVAYRRVQLNCTDPSIVKQSFKDECNINSIISKYRKTGFVSHLSSQPGRYDDVSSVPDYMSALNIVRNSQELFSELPSVLRERFGNNPLNLISFLSDDKNRDEAIKLGLVKAPLAPPQTPPQTP